MVRGTMLRPLRDQLCLLKTRAGDDDSSEKIPDYCRGCHLNATCEYGRVFEPDRLIIDGRVRMGCRDGVRGVTIGAAGLNLRDRRVQAGDRLAVRFLFVGPAAIKLKMTILEMLRDVSQNATLGPDRIRFRVDGDTIRRDSFDLFPDKFQVQSSPGDDRVSILLRLHSPLCLKSRPEKSSQDGGRSPSRDFTRRRRFGGDAESIVTVPRLIRESVRIVRRVFDEIQPDLVWHDTAAFLDECLTLAERSEIDLSRLRATQQTRGSARKNSKWELTGWVGEVTLHHVPLIAVPWLIWAGILGVGDSRNCGAGLWTITRQDKCARAGLVD